MFLKEEEVITEYIRNCKSGKTTKYNRTKILAHFKCDNCGSHFTRHKGNDIDKKRCNNDYSHYCPECPAHALAQAKGRKVKKQKSYERLGEKIITNHGYVSVWVADTYTLSDKPHCGRIYEHIMVMEQHLNRALEKGEVVHHIDGNKQNNSIDNLDVMHYTEHNRCHGRAANTLLMELYRDGIIIYDKKNKRYIKNG